MNQQYKTIVEWVDKNAHVLDLGCGDGQLLLYLKQAKQINGYGLEIDVNKLTNAVAKGINVLQYDLNDGLHKFHSHSFDYALLTFTLQSVRHPDILLDDMLRVAKQAVVTFPNFNHWRHLYQLIFKRRMPVSKSIPYTWYNSPNIHLCTLRDFESLCREKNITILQRNIIDNNEKPSWLSKSWPNFYAPAALYRISKL